MKTTSIRLLALTLLAVLPACSKKPVDVTAQIFVVTKGRENIKMGGLEVRLIPDGEFLNMAKATVPWMQEEVRKEAQFKADADFMTAFIKELLAMEEAAPNPIPELQGIRKAIVKESGVSKNLFESASSGQILQRGMGKLISSATSTLSVTTDADGRFTVPITGKTWFLAVGQREVGEDMEEYLWVKGFEPQGDATSATLAISNEADIDSEDGLYSLLTAAIGTLGGLETSRKVDVSEKMKSLVTKHREAATEAKAKADREAAEAKAKADKEAAEAKAKLAAEIGAGRVGATTGVPLAGKAVMPFVFCPSGAFTMGSPTSEEGRSGDENQVSVTLSKGFWMATTEVTQAQWQAVMGNNPSRFEGVNLPVENVSWHDAQEFIKKVNGSGVMPSGWKFAMPTEAQWEYTCRAGVTGPYSGGTIEQVAWYDGNSASKTHDVGTKKANAWGLHDMHGNVWEWCEDWHSDTLAGGTDPSGAPSGVDRASRGGSCAANTSFDGGFILPGDETSKNNTANCRAAVRFRSPPDDRFYYLGFRPALVPSE